MWYNAHIVWGGRVVREKVNLYLVAMALWRVGLIFEMYTSVGLGVSNGATHGSYDLQIDMQTRIR